MRNWDIKDETGSCTGDKDLQDAAYVCDVLGIRLHEVNFVKEYWNQVFRYFCAFEVLFYISAAQHPAHKALESGP